MANTVESILTSLVNATNANTDKANSISFQTAVCKLNEDKNSFTFPEGVTLGDNSVVYFNFVDETEDKAYQSGMSFVNNGNGISTMFATLNYPNPQYLTFSVVDGKQIATIGGNKNVISAQSDLNVYYSVIKTGEKNG